MIRHVKLTWYCVLILDWLSKVNDGRIIFYRLWIFFRCNEDIQSHFVWQRRFFFCVLTLTLRINKIHGSNEFHQFWSYYGCWGSIPLGCMYMTFWVHRAQRVRDRVPLFFLLFEFCNGLISSVCNTRGTLFGWYW